MLSHCTVTSLFTIAFIGVGSWSFGNDFPRNVVTFDVDNRPSSQVRI